MKAMIFAAGLGTRLRPLTDHLPKALVEVGGEPMLGRVLRRAIEAGVDEAVVNVHHLPGMIAEYLAANHDFEIKIHLSREDNMLLDTGGGLLAARRWLEGGEDILVHNADIYTDVDLKALYAAHIESGADATLLAWERNSGRGLLVDDEGRMCGWCNDATGEVRPEGVDRGALRKVSFSGVQVVSPRIFPRLEEYVAEHGRVFSIMPFYIAMCSSLRILTYTPSVLPAWVDIGRPEALEQLRNKQI